MTPASQIRNIPRLGLNRNELALAIGVSVNTVDKMVQDGALPPPRKWNTRKIWIIAEVEAAMHEWPIDGEPTPDVVRSISRSPQASTDYPSRGQESASAHADDPLAPLIQWYENIGFDPKTMNDADLERLRMKAEDEWRASIPSRPLGQRERSVLDQLAPYGPGQRVHFREVKNHGPDTEDRLKARGFVEAFGNNKFPDRSIYVMLTDAGFEAWKKIAKSQ